MKTQLTRRQFTAATIATALTAKNLRAAAGSNETIRLGFIGVGNRGDQLLDYFKPHSDAQVVALCDVYQPYLDFALKKTGGTAFVTKDYRQVLERKDVDAVVIATPDHWHALQCIEACAAGKDVYVEKPCSLVVAEGRAMVNAAQKYQRVVQVGLQRRSTPFCQKAVELIQGGAIGKVTVARCFHVSNEFPLGIGQAPDTDPPPELDWDRWLGPAPKAPYNVNRCLYKFRWFRDYSGGQVTNMGTHFIDVIQWALQQNAPTGVFATGRKVAIDDEREIPVNLECVWEYPDDTLVTFSQFNANKAPGDFKDSLIEFRGTKGTLYLGPSHMELVPEPNRLKPVPALDPRYRKENALQAAATQPASKAIHQKGSVTGIEHARNFLDCMRSRKEPACSIETGHRSSTTTLLANLSYDRKRHLTWDAQAERFTDDEEANKLLDYPYRSPWKLPTEGRL